MDDSLRKKQHFLLFKLPKMDDLENSDLLRSSIPNMFHWASIDPYHLNLISSPWSWPVQLKVHDLVDLALCQGEAPRWNRLIYHGLIFVCQANHDQKPQINQLIPIIHIIYMCVCVQSSIHYSWGEYGRIRGNDDPHWPIMRFPGTRLQTSRNLKHQTFGFEVSWRFMAVQGASSLELQGMSPATMILVNLLHRSL
jgi:hypothetical protein